MANESTWRDRFLKLCFERAQARGHKFVWLVLNVSNQRGVPDTLIHLHKGGAQRGCAFVEFKKGRAVVRPIQKARILGFDNNGVRAYVVRLLNREEAVIEYCDDCGGKHVMLPMFDGRMSWDATVNYLLGLLE